MHRRVEHRHHLAAPDVERHRHDDRAAEQTRKAARQRSLAVARCPVDEDRRSRVDRGAYCFGDARRQLDAGKRGSHLGQVEGPGLGGLSEHGPVLAQRYRRRPRIARARPRDLFAACSALLGERVGHPFRQRPAEPRPLLVGQSQRVQEVGGGQHLEHRFD